MTRCLRLFMAAGALAFLGPLAGQALADDSALAKYTGAKEWDSPEAIGLIAKVFGIKL